MASSQLEIIRRACSNSGNGTIDSIDDNDEIARLTQQHYEAIVQDMLCTRSPKFAQRNKHLTKYNLTPDLPWVEVYEAPADMLALKLVETNTAQRLDAEECNTIYGRGIQILCPETCVIAVYTARVSEAVWPADFAMAVQLRMEAVFLAAIAEQRDQAQRREGRADAKEQRAKVRDRSASTASDPSEWDLTVARRRSTAWSSYRAR